eukprot:364047-Chlamydomonas_euryale.AAC.3
MLAYEPRGEACATLGDACGVRCWGPRNGVSCSACAALLLSLVGIWIGRAYFGWLCRPCVAAPVWSCWSGEGACSSWRTAAATAVGLLLRAPPLAASGCAQRAPMSQDRLWPPSTEGRALSDDGIVIIVRAASARERACALVA